jgi:RNA-directed DNA polymerase
MQTSLQAIAEKAKRLKEYRFQNLYGMLDIERLKEAWKKIKKKAAPGVDGMTAAEYAKNLEENVRSTVEELKKKRYKARLIRRAYIPKEKGKDRPLGILAVRDKVVQQAAATVLGAIFEQDFLSCSYAYRQEVGPQQAVKELTRELQLGRYNYIVEADIRGFYDNINHELLNKMVEQRVDDQAMIRLIRKWLNAGILEEDGKIIDPVTGTIQGGVISPLLANIYLHYALDLWFEKVVKPLCEGQAYMCRFADDFVCAFQYKSDAEKFFRVLGKRLGKFMLELAAEKTKIIPFSPFQKREANSFEFLGFEFRWGVSRKGRNIIKRRTSRKKLRKSLANFTCWCRKNRSKPLWKLFRELNSKLRGYYNYYGVRGNYDSLMEFFDQAKRLLFKWLNRRSQRASFNWKEFERYWNRYRVLRPRITERSYQLKLNLSFGV